MMHGHIKVYFFESTMFYKTRAFHAKQIDYLPLAEGKRVCICINKCVNVWTRGSLQQVVTSTFYSSEIM
jgi:hypothetical protein